jgi:hypothetical protein
MERRLHRMEMARRRRRIMMYNLISFVSIIIILIVMAFSFLASNISVAPSMIAATPAPTIYFN